MRSELLSDGVNNVFHISNTTFDFPFIIQDKITLAANQALLNKRTTVYP